MQSRRIESLYLLVRIDPHSSILRLIERLTFLLLLTLFAFPHIVVAEPSVDVVNSNAGDYSHPVAPIKELPLSIRSNCWNYVMHVLGTVIPTATIKANLSDKGEIGFLLYGSVEHYVAVHADDGVNVSFCESHFYGNTISCRKLPKSDFVGFYSI